MTPANNIHILSSNYQSDLHFQYSDNFHTNVQKVAAAVKIVPQYLQVMTKNPYESWGVKMAFGKQ